jgi:hypothetical protein
MQLRKIARSLQFQEMFSTRSYVHFVEISGNNPTAKPYRSMAEREEQRKQRRLELERRYESARKQKEAQ